MKSALRALLLCSPLLLTPAHGQLLLNVAPTRTIGQTSLTIAGSNPNLIEGRELYFPQSIALDTSVSPARLYIADTLNNRVLGFKNASSFSNGQKADLVLGQPDFRTTFAQGPGRTSRTTGFTDPTGLAVDAAGNLYVADSGNNRILRFPKPFTQSGDQLPDMVIGQKTFSTAGANQGVTGGSSDSTLSLTTTAGPQQTFPIFDSDGNLWVPDPGNNRVIRFNATTLANGGNGPSADVVIGQTDFLTNTYSPQTGTNATLSLRSMAAPTSVVFDTGGRMFISESRSNARGRILVYNPPFTSGMPATRLLAANVDVPQPPTVNETQLGASSSAMFTVGDSVGIADSANNRLLIFPPFDSWTSNQNYQAAMTVLGQPDFSSSSANQKLPEPGPATFSAPTGAYLYNGELFVVDANNNRVLVMAQNGSGFDPANRVLGQDGFNFNAANLVEGREFDFTSNGSADTGMVTDFKSAVPHLYVADPYNNRILCYRDLRNVRPGDKADFVIGQPDLQHVLINYPANDVARPNRSGLYVPTGLTLDANGNLYVADTGNSRVLRFPAPFDNYVPGTMPQADLVLGQISFTSTITDPSARTMAAPYGLAYASTQGLLVSDLIHNRVLFFQGRPENLQSGQSATYVFGQPDFVTVTSGTTDDKMSAPHHISTDTDDRLYVADTGNARIMIFDHAPTAGSGSHAAVTLTGFSAPRSIFVNQITGEIWIADASANTVTRFPQFNNIPGQGFVSNTVLTETAPIAVTQDVYGNVYVADATNRVVMHYPGVTATNSANFLRSTMVPGMIASLFASNLGTKQFGGSPTSASTVPLSKILNHLQVTINDIVCPIFYADDSQLNVQMPWSLGTSGTANIAITDTTTGRVVGAAIVALASVNPGLFTADGTGKGPAAAVNSDGTINSSKNPAAQGSYITLYGTGQGPVNGTLPADGAGASGTQNTTQRAPTVIMNVGPIPDGDIQYSGLAPGLVGVWQINARIPDNAPPSTATAPIQVIVLQDSTPSGGAGLGRPVTLYIKQKP